MDADGYVWTILYPPTNGGYGIALSDDVLAVLTPCCSALTNSTRRGLIVCCNCDASASRPSSLPDNKDLGYLSRVPLREYEESSTVDFTDWAKYWAQELDIRCVLSWEQD